MTARTVPVATPSENETGETAPGTGWFHAALPLAASVLLVSMVAHFRVPLLADIGRELAMSASSLGLVATVFAIGRLALDLPVGRLADRIDPLKLLAFAAAAMGVSSLGLAFAPSAAWVLWSSLLLGMASATGNTTGMTALSGSAPPARRGSAMALYSGALLGGQALGPAVSGAVASLGTWRTAAFVATGLGLAVGVATAAWRRRTGHVPLRRNTKQGAGDDVAELTPLQRGALYGVCFSVFFTLGAMPQTLVPLLGAIDHGLRTATIGLAIGIGGSARMLGAAISGAVSDRVSRRAALLPALALQAAGVALLAVGGSAAVWLAAIILMSLGSSGNAVAATMLGDRTHGARLGRTLGRYRFWGDIGLVVGPALTAFVYDRAGVGPAVGLVSGVLIMCAVAAAVVVPETYGRGSRAVAGQEMT
ncbi:MAG: MFS transporter [Nitriliruptorales bacterium]|nr:MFS transporter [Nitriliruptorales bacterium]